MQIAKPWRSLIRVSLWSGLGLAWVSTTVVAQYGGPTWQPRPWRATWFQEEPKSFTGIEQPETPPEGGGGARNPLVLVAGGVVGYVVTRGLIHAYGQVATRRNCSPCVLEGLLAVPLFLAIPTLTPLGVHLANDRRGSLGADWLASTTVAIGALLIGASQGANYETMMIAVLASSILAAVAAELFTTPPRPAAPGR